jgi:hypothetical protein
MKIGSIQGISVAYYIRTGKNELKPVVAMKQLDRTEAAKAVNVTISKEAKELYWASKAGK